MSIGRKIELAVAALIMLTILALYGYGKWQHHGKAVAQEHYQVASGDAKSYKVMAAGTKRIAAQEQRVHEELHQALEANPEWADEPVPSSVARLMCHDADAACGVVPAPAGDGAEAGSADEWGHRPASR